MIKEFEPLKCVAISTKRYALYNEGPDGEPILRKASAHGLGDVGYPQDYDPAASPTTAPEHIAAGIRGGKRQYNDLVQGAGARFFFSTSGALQSRSLRKARLKISIGLLGI